MSYKTFISDRKKFISQFDGFKPRENNGEERHLQNLVDEYREILDDLEIKKSQVEEVLSLGAVDYSIAEKRKFYPNSMKTYHGIRAAVITGIITSAATYGLLALLGQGNPLLWSSTLRTVCIGMSLPVAMGAAAIPTVLSVKKFFNAQKNKRKPKVRFIEKRILDREQKRQAAFSTLALKAQTSLDAILTGDVSLQKEVKVKGKMFGFFGPIVTKSKFVYNDEFKELEHLPFFTKRKLNKIINSYTEQVTTLREQHNLLRLHTEKISSMRKEKKEIKNVQVQQTPPVVIVKKSTQQSSPEVVSKTPAVKVVSKNEPKHTQKEAPTTQNTPTRVVKKTKRVVSTINDPRKPVYTESKRIHKRDVGSKGSNSSSSQSSGTRRG